MIGNKSAEKTIIRFIIYIKYCMLIFDYNIDVYVD